MDDRQMSAQVQVELSSKSVTAALRTKMTIEAQATLREQERKEREQRLATLDNYLLKSTLSEKEKISLRQELAEKESEYNRCKRAKLKKSDFETIKVIGRGGFGEVRLVVKKNTNMVFAMKLMRKKDMIERGQTGHVKAERDILAQTHFTNDWVVKLFYSFQDDETLYLLMEYLGGGDMMTLLIRENIFSHDMARFYTAELLMAIDSIHKLNYIHRDIKPDNILFDNAGHIKLTDFGLCTGFHKDHESTYFDMVERASKLNLADLKTQRFDKDLAHDYKNKKRNLAYSVVGTPDYTAPEVFLQKGYYTECDYWSVGCILFEMLAGYPPFVSDDSVQTCLKIINCTETLQFPDDVEISPDAQDLIKKLVCPKEDRLSNLELIKKHPFFKGFDWDNIFEQAPPYMPKLKSPFDTSNFDEFEMHEEEAEEVEHSGKEKPKDLAFVGYTYKGFLNVVNSPSKKRHASGVTLSQIFSTHIAN
ncbi:serine/threonine protein kinase, putative [Entamoeba invadens IP1]|uniref:non-specific serine/threonine protein kinase n=1 Tax=Entamoeba invadens IP1 TaxID=370355 RepID=A0A0A1U248_ENTIV|nr:serine/threonine protein kinase, putative [Entamoeba invadens IP1]ELP88146.1 serine/threonine protein kinase, putative [Entamoeba invadens IP1]|eukprot:XP_004254917.1 serine/threonine protein kinase, putative [Entamoeba invadens IP1]